MYLHELAPNPGAKHRRKRVGRGIGSGHGKTAGRGTKGQKARDQVPLTFEGGQTPLHRRLPRQKGFKNPTHKEFTIVNVALLEERFEAGDVVTPEVLLERRIIKKLEKDGLKVLGEGELTKALTVRAHQFSKSAEQKITAAGGTVEAI
ncbi:MAG: 50S ribosomal protein L15 [bacterium]|nr:50S ribosomal protein L15 [bacterium]MCS7308904.1 50S ribosomal protein L15 [Armatimonadota bacterium]MDW8103541.1 50S ribosomal protein L15 [Armatimonadota bacterium]